MFDNIILNNGLMLKRSSHTSLTQIITDKIIR